EEKEAHRARRLRDLEIEHESSGQNYTDDAFIKSYAAKNMEDLLRRAPEIKRSFSRFKTADLEFADSIKKERPELYALASFEVRALAEAERLHVELPSGPPKPRRTEEDVRQHLVRLTMRHFKDELELQKAFEADGVNGPDEQEKL